MTKPIVTDPATPSVLLGAAGRVLDMIATNSAIAGAMGFADHPAVGNTSYRFVPLITGYLAGHADQGVPAATIANAILDLACAQILAYAVAYGHDRAAQGALVDAIGKRLHSQAQMYEALLLGARPDAAPHPDPHPKAPANGHAREQLVIATPAKPKKQSPGSRKADRLQKRQVDRVLKRMK